MVVRGGGPRSCSIIRPMVVVSWCGPGGFVVVVPWRWSVVVVPVVAVPVVVVRGGRPVVVVPWVQVLFSYFVWFFFLVFFMVLGWV